VIPDKVSIPLLLFVGAVLGEVLYIALHLSRYTHVFDPVAAARLLPRIVWESGGFHIAVKIAALVCFCVVGSILGASKLKPVRLDMT